MGIPIIKAFILVLCCLLPTMKSYAEVEVALFMGAEDFSFVEFSEDGSTLVDESGTLGAVGIELGWQHDNWLARLQTHVIKGETDYQSGAIRSTVDHRIDQYHFTAAYQYLIGETPLRWLVAYGKRNWQRDIDAPPGMSGLEESYRWPYLSLGVEADWLLWQGRLRVSGQWRAIHNAELKVRFPAGQFDSASIDMDSGKSVGVNIAWSTDFSSNWSYGAMISWDRWWFDRSAETVLFTGGLASNVTAAQPENTTTQTGVFLLLNYRYPS